MARSHSEAVERVKREASKSSMLAASLVQSSARVPLYSPLAQRRLFGLTQIFAPHPLALICLQLVGEMRVGGLVVACFSPVGCCANPQCAAIPPPMPSAISCLEVTFEFNYSATSSVQERPCGLNTSCAV